MKKNCFLTLFIALFLTFFSVHYVMIHREIPSSKNPQTNLQDCHIIPSQTPPPAPSLQASGACVMDTNTGRILYGKNESISLPMASTTKIMTCILALEHGNLSDSVTFSSKACRMPKVHLGASQGSAFTLEDMLYSLMLESHNDTAVAIAEHIGGSVEGFAAMMNAKAMELGLNLTNFVTPNGLDAQGHMSSPHDMCKLAAYAIQNQSFQTIIQTPAKTIHTTDGKSTFSLTNRDLFLTTYSGALGIKTGFTNKAGYCFVGAASRDNLTLTSCVLASGWPPNKSYKWSDTKALMDYGFSHFTYRSLPITDLSACQLPVSDGVEDTVSLTMPQIPAYLLSDFDKIDILYEIPTGISAPVRKDIAIGHICIQINDRVVERYPIFPSSNVPKITYMDIFLEIFAKFA